MKHIERDLALAEQAVTTPDSEPQGRLCIASTSAFGRHVLAPLIPAFSARYPLLSIELITTDRRVNHAREDVDVSLRIAPQLEDQLMARHIARIPFICCASAVTCKAPAYPPRLRPCATTAAWCFAIRWTGAFCVGASCATACASRRNLAAY